MKWIGRITTATALLVLAFGSLAADDEIGQFYAGDALRIHAGQTHEGDLYAFAGKISIDGLQDGDLFSTSGPVTISGEVAGDVVAAGEKLTIDGRVSDSVRFFGAEATIEGTVEGDLVVFCGTLTVREEGRVTGNVVVFGGRTVIDGTVDGELRVLGGEVSISGTIGKGANLKVDTIRVSPDARIHGDLNYTARKELALANDEIVSGDVRFEQKVEQDPGEGSSGFSVFSVATWIWFTLSAMLVGAVALALFRRTVPALVAEVENETMIGALVGFGAFLVVPAAATLSLLLVFSIPLGVLTLLIFLVALYLAKIPVAIWLGRRLLGLMGRDDPSPYPALMLGLLVLYLLFPLPCLLGSFVWLATTWLGLGAMILATRTYLQERGT